MNIKIRKLFQLKKSVDAIKVRGFYIQVEIGIRLSAVDNNDGLSRNQFPESFEVTDAEINEILAENRNQN